MPQLVYDPGQRALIGARGRGTGRYIFSFSTRGKKLRLLLVEDNETLAEWLAKLLRAERYVVDCVPDGEAAVFGTDFGNYDLAIVDLGLPKMSGIDVIREFRARGYS